MRPTGTVTFLFTDIEGSTQLWEKYPQAMKAALGQHDAILREAIESRQGHIVKTTGDGVHAVFGAAADAVNTVLSAQQLLLAQPWTGSDPLRVRMALHTGEAEWREGDTYGPAVNRAARLMSVASGGQILLSAATTELTRDLLPAGASLKDLGRHRMKDLLRPEHVFQLLHPDLPADFPPLKSSSTVPNNLPVQITSFIGRQREIKEVRDMISPDAPEGESFAIGGQVRLLTLTGPGGTGKTRLSLQASGDLLDQFPDGVWLVELATLADPQLVMQTVAAPLGLRELPGRPLQERLADYLRPRQVLLILDNCEHLIDECARLAGELLRSCPKLRILASSREGLGIAGEQVYRVRSLSLPPEQDGLSVEELARFDTIRLFVERAKAVKPSFALLADNATAIQQICRRLDGIPLAIELAAARVRVLSPEQIAIRLDNRFRLLTGGSRTALPRQRTLQALIDWSYDLLSEAECILLRHLSVFSGGWTLEAAEAVAAAESGPVSIEPYEVLDLLEQLVNKSLVVAKAGDLGMRYHMLETIRQYAQEKLAESGEAAGVRDRHLAYFVDLHQHCFEEASELRGNDCLNELAFESDNLRIAKAWAIEHDLKAALQLMTVNTPRWGAIIPGVEALRTIEDALELASTSHLFTGREALPENRRLFGITLTSAGAVAFGLGLNQKSLDYTLRGAEIARKEGDLSPLAWALGMAAPISAMLGDLESAHQYHVESMVLIPKIGSCLAKAMLLVSLSKIFLEGTAHNSEKAWSEWEEGMAMFRQGHVKWGLGWGHQVAAQVSMITRDAAAAQSHAEQSLAFFSEIGDSLSANMPRSILAKLARKHGDLEDATLIYNQLARSWRDSGNFGAMARCLECLAFIAHAQARDVDDKQCTTLLGRAAELLGAADTIRRDHNSPMVAYEQPEYKRELAAIQEEAGESAFQNAWQQGRAMNQDQAIELVN